MKHVSKKHENKTIVATRITKDSPTLNSLERHLMEKLKTFDTKISQCRKKVRLPRTFRGFLLFLIAKKIV